MWFGSENNSVFFKAAGDVEATKKAHAAACGINPPISARGALLLAASGFSVGALWF